MRFLSLFLFLACGTLFGQTGPDELYTLQSGELTGDVQTVFDSSYVLRRDTTGAVFGRSVVKNFRYDYAESGQLLGRTFFSYSGEEIYRETVVYENDRIAYADHHFLSDNSRYRKVFSYDRQGRLSKITETDSTRKEKTVNSWQYDRGGRIVRSYEDCGLGSADYRYVYDSAGLLISKVYASGKRFFERISYGYDNGRKISETEELFDNNEVTFKTVTAFDGNLPVRIDEYFKDTLTSSRSYVYTFDSEGNWITRVISVNGLEECFAFRKIVYYEYIPERP